MRVVALGQGLYFVWHLPTLLLAVGALGLAALMGRSLWRDHLAPRARALRWSIFGWASVMASLLSVVVWPYLGAVTTVRVAPDGAWRLDNYLGVELARIPAGEARAVRAPDLGGLRWGSGHVEFVRVDGSVLRSVRVGGASFERLCASMGYTAPMLHESLGAVTIPAHVYTARGPVLLASLASR